MNSRHLPHSCPAGRLTHLVLAVLLLVTATSCEQSDDIDTIFTTRSWSFTGFCYTPNWDKGESSILDINYEGKDACYLNTVTFHSTGAADINMPGCSLTGRWKADGVSRTFALTDLRVVTGSLNDISAFSRKFYDELTTAAWYRGDALSLQLYNADEHYYLLFGPIR